MSQSDVASQLAEGVGREFRRRLLEEYVPRIRYSVGLLDQEQLWHRPGAKSNSVANLLLHLEGNVRQWILSGLGGEEDRRQRDREFAAGQEEEGTKARGPELLDRLEATVEQAVAVVEGLGPEDLLRVACFQGRYEETGLAAVLHVMEHFSCHAGQIHAFTKETLEIDLKFYDL